MKTILVLGRVSLVSALQLVLALLLQESYVICCTNCWKYWTNFVAVSIFKVHDSFNQQRISHWCTSCVRLSFPGRSDSGLQKNMDIRIPTCTNECFDGIVHTLTSTFCFHDTWGSEPTSLESELLKTNSHFIPQNSVVEQALKMLRCSDYHAQKYHHGGRIGSVFDVGTSAEPVEVLPFFSSL